MYVDISVDANSVSVLKFLCAKKCAYSSFCLITGAGEAFSSHTLLCTTADALSFLLERLEWTVLFQICHYTALRVCTYLFFAECNVLVLDQLRNPAQCRFFPLNCHFCGIVDDNMTL